MIRPRLLLRAPIAAVAVALMAQPTVAPAPGPAPEIVAPLVLGEPRLLYTGPYTDIGPLAPQADSGFLIAVADYGDDLVVGRFADDGTREALHALGSLGYSELGNLRSLAPLDVDSFAVTWDRDQHWVGFRESRRVFFHDCRRRGAGSTDALAPALIGDGKGGAIGVFLVEGSTVAEGKSFFGHWSMRNRLIAQRRLHRVGRPYDAQPLGSGVLITSSVDGTGYALTWLDADGNVLDRGSVPFGTVATDGDSALVAVARSASGLLLTARVGASPSRLGPPRVVGNEAAAFPLLDTAATFTPDGGVLVAWTLYAQPDADCGIWLRVLSPSGEPLGDAVCGAPPDAERPQLATSADGTVWLAWRTLDISVIPFLGRIWQREVVIQ